MVDNDKFLLEKTGFSESYVSETGIPVAPRHVQSISNVTPAPRFTVFRKRSKRAS